MTNSDRDLLVETANNVKWIRETIQEQRAEIKETQHELDNVKKRVNYLFGGLGAFEFLSHITGFFKS